MIPQSEFETNALASGKITYTIKMYHNHIWQILDTFLNVLKNIHVELNMLNNVSYY